MTFMARAAGALVSAVLLSIPVEAQQAPPDCSAPEHRQFDFWLGEWTVFDPNGRQVGTNSITRELDGCVLHERWQSAGRNRGYSYNIYNRVTGRWHQTWVDNGGTLLRLDGGLQGSSMVLEGRTQRPGAPERIERITWTPQADGSVRQLWQQSVDGGQTWGVAFDGKYVRRR